MDYGIKVSQPGYDVKTATPSQLVFSSKYQTPRIQAQGTGIITNSGGRTVTIAHNLGYIPAFVVHTQSDPVYQTGYDDYFINPVVPFVGGACNISRNVDVYVDTTNLYIEVGSDFGWQYYYTQLNSANYGNDDDGGYNKGWSEVGKVNGIEDGAFRFLDVDIAQGTNIQKADLGFYVYVKYGSDVVKFKLYGIDEDNTADFASSPFGRSKTSAVSIISGASPSSGDTEIIEITNQVNEILGRSGWSSGNPMGFLLMDDGTAQDSSMYTDSTHDDCFYCSCSYLRILKLNTLLNYKYTIFYNQMV